MIDLMARGLARSGDRHGRRLRHCSRAFIPVVTLAVVGDDSRSMFDGRYVVDDYALILKALFLLTAYVVDPA